MHNLYINQTKAPATPKTIPTQVFSPQPNIRSDDVLFEKVTVPKQHNNPDQESMKIMANWIVLIAPNLSLMANFIMSVSCILHQMVL